MLYYTALHCTPTGLPDMQLVEPEVAGEEGAGLRNWTMIISSIID